MTKVYSQAVPGVVFLPDGKTPPAKKARIEGEGQDDGGSEQVTPSAPPPGGAMATEPGPPTYAQVMTGQAPPGRPTMIFRNGRLEQVETLPLATDISQVFEMTPGVMQMPNPAAAFPESTRKIEQLGNEQVQAEFQKATAELGDPDRACASLCCLEGISSRYYRRRQRIYG